MAKRIFKFLVRSVTSYCKRCISFSRLLHSAIIGLITSYYCFYSLSMACSKSRVNFTLDFVSFLIVFDDSFFRSLCSFCKPAYFLTISFVLTPYSMTARYQLTISIPFSSTAIFSFISAFYFYSLGSSCFSSYAYRLLTLYCSLKSAIEKAASFWMRKRRCSLILGTRQSYRLRAVRLSMAYSASMTGVFRQRFYSRRLI